LTNERKQMSFGFGVRFLTTARKGFVEWVEEVEPVLEDGDVMRCYWFHRMSEKNALLGARLTTVLHAV